VKCDTELEEGRQITAWRQLARAALNDQEAEQRLLGILEQHKGALGAFEDSGAGDIYRLPPHLRYGPFYDHRKGL
jgi:hypothetical protein